jgi:glycosyltransferase involved in cell wall biosynthesis
LYIHWVDDDSAFDMRRRIPPPEASYWRYLLWIRKAFSCAGKLQTKERFELVHHVGLGTVSVPSPFWKLGCPLVWGPLGGGQVAPRSLISIFKDQWLEETLRTLRVKALPFHFSFRRSVREASRVLATNQETVAILKAGGAARVDLMLDNALRSEFIPKALPARERKGCLNLLWAGRLIRLKALDLALKAVAVLGPNSGVWLSIVGDGPLRREFEETAKDLGLTGRVTFKGSVAWRDMAREFLSADSFLFTSVRESFGSVVLEAAAYGLPVIALDHQGVGTLLPSGTGLKVPVSTVDETTAAIARAIEYVRDYPAERETMGRAAYAYARQNTWEARASEMETIYREVQSAQRIEP